MRTCASMLEEGAWHEASLEVVRTCARMLEKGAWHEAFT